MRPPEEVEPAPMSELPSEQPVSQTGDLSLIEGDTTTTPPTPVVQTPVPARGKSHRAAIIISVIAVVIALTSVGGLGGFYYLVRTPNHQYDAAIQNLEAMKTQALAIREQNNVDKPIESTDDNVLAEAKQQAAIYAAELAELQQNPVLLSDLRVKAAYSQGAPVLEPYGQDTLDFVATVTSFEEVRDECETAIRKVYAGVNESTYQDITADCKDLLDRYEIMPAKSFANHYQTYRDGLLDLFAATDEYFYVLTYVNDAAKRSAAQNDFQAAATKMRGILALKAQISNAADETGPGDEIDAVITELQARRDVFFRR